MVPPLRTNGSMTIYDSRMIAMAMARIMVRGLVAFVMTAKPSRPPVGRDENGLVGY